MLPSNVVTRTYICEDFDIPIPIVSISTHPDNLYSDELGIFVRGVNGRAGLGQSTACNWNMDWDRPLNFEYLVDGKEVINQEVSVKRNGAYSRAYTPYGFKIKAEKLLGDNRFRYQFFRFKPHLRHKQLVFRSAGNDYNCRVRDPSVQDIALRSGLNVDAQGYEPVVHFINGLYRGTINLREPNNKNFVFANYGYDDDRTIELRCNIQEYAWDLVKFEQLCDSDNPMLAIRSYSGLNRTQFAQRYGIPYRTVEDWESGKSKPPKYVEALLRRCVVEDFK